LHFIAFVHQDAVGFGLSFPDVQGCVAHGPTLEAALASAQAALAFHVEGILADAEPLPSPRSADAIAADDTLTEWRQGATLAYVPLILDRGSPRRVNGSLDPGLLDAIDAAARARGMNRSAFLASAARKEIA